jgi:hypothetical protein
MRRVSVNRNSAMQHPRCRPAASARLAFKAAQ